ncbi:MAG: hypothetical protein ACW98F_06170 [Candidatus Hodarchaeales archaeon]|jgi:hypothetical protein
MSTDLKEPTSKGDIAELIKILEYLNYEATISLNGVDPALVFQ